MLTLVALPALGAAQTSGSIIGRVLDAQTHAPLAGVAVRLTELPHNTISDSAGRFLLGGVPPGEHSVRAQLIGYQALQVDGVAVRAARAVEIELLLPPGAVNLQELVIRAERQRLIEPQVSATHEVVVAREIRELPIDRLSEIIELTTGVSQGHFRGGRVGQEVFVIDGLALKNQLEASTEGLGLEISPTALEEIDVITGGFGAAFGAALSGVVSYTTRRGNPERWEGRAALSTDAWAPASMYSGFSGLSLSAGGPLSALGRGTTVFADLTLQGLFDADPRAAGLSCLTPEITDPALAGTIRTLQADERTSHLVCPYTHHQLPHQQGDKYMAFLRVDRPLSPGLHLTGTLLQNRFQRELYTSEFKYNSDYQLGQRSAGTLATLALESLSQRQGNARSLIGRLALLRLDRQLGVVQPRSLEDRFQIAGFGPSGFHFLGESFLRRPIEEQLNAASAVPGYSTPGGSTGSPFGPAATGLFFTSGTPGLASWTRSDLLAVDLVAAFFRASGSAFRTGVSSKLYRAESYERAFAHLAGSIPNYARFYPASHGIFAEADIETEDGMRFQVGLRADAFRSGIGFRENRADFLEPTVETGWKLSFLPRFGAAFPIPGTQQRTALRLNYSRVAQPPDYQYFLDSTVGDSLRTDIRRQGNPDLAFEQGTSFEAGLSHLFGENLALGVTVFRKNLEHLVTGSVRPGDVGTAGQFSTSDFGTVRGLELSVRARWSGITARAGWAMQKATGLTSGLDTDSALIAGPALTEYPLAFDRRHSADLTLLAGRGGENSWPWSAAFTLQAQSGYPLLRTTTTVPAQNPALPPQSAITVREVDRYLPWTWTADLRASYDLGALVCRRCAWRVVADGRNIFNRKNVLAVRRETATLAPTLAEVESLAATPGLASPIPRESPIYNRLIDLNRDGFIDDAEFRTARFAAALDRFDPSLLYGEARQLRLGIEVGF